MGKGRDKRKKREDASKAVKRVERQVHKLHKKEKQSAPSEVLLLNNEESVQETLQRIQKAERKIKTVEEVENVSPPTPRVNVVLCHHPTRQQELIIFGGEFFNGEITEAYNDTYFYHTKRGTWSKLSTFVNPPPRSSSQGIVFKEYMIIFGGEFVSQSQSQFHHFRDVWRFDAKTSEWTEMKGLKGGPSSRSGHRMALWKRQAVLFGGFYDNSQECYYFNDVWLLSSLGGSGKWESLETLGCGGELPHPRSGHNMAVCNDTLFVYGGYSTQKFNRFKKSEATMHHDLWMLPLPVEKELQPSENLQTDTSNKPTWIKIRLDGIPPPIRCGVGSCMKDKKLYLFGGVVDLQSPGGKLISTFSNDLFVFHMDSKRFYPVVLRRPKTKASGREIADGDAKTRQNQKIGDLQSELKALELDYKTENDEGDSSSSDDEEEVEDWSAEPEKDPASREMKNSYEKNKLGQITPHRRMDAAIVSIGNYLYIYGGQFESGNKEITMSDLYALNLKRLETYEVLLSQDLSTAVWMGRDSECSADTWESGSTFASTVFQYYDDEEDEDDEDDMQHQQEEKRGDLEEDGPLDAENDIPDVVPIELPHEVTPNLYDLPKRAVDGLTRTEKKGLKVHKEELFALLRSTSSAVPAPEKEESFQEFYQRTSDFWENTVKDSSEQRLKKKQLKNEAVEFCRRRFREVRELLEQIRLVDEQEKEEAKFLHQRRLEKEKEWEEWERQQWEIDEKENKEEEEPL